MTTRLLIGDVRAELPKLESGSVQMCVTSPPYWGLRSYLPDGHERKHLEIGREPTVDAWVGTMVKVFREVRRVLRDDGVLFLNLGDSYAGSWGAQSRQDSGDVGRRSLSADQIVAAPKKTKTGSIPVGAPYKAKDLIGQPWLIAFALRADGWYLRQEIIWHKPAPMPESTRDRCTKAHEHIFLLSKQPRYFWNFDAIQEPVSGGAHPRLPGNRTHGKLTESLAADRDGEHRTKGGLVAYADRKRAGVGRRGGPPGNPSERKLAEAGSGTKNNASFDEAMAVMPDTRNPRSVWTIPAEPFKGSHFATFPRELARRCIAAGSREGDTVLDPFGGSGTVGVVAHEMHRRSILIDIDERNRTMATDRIVGASPLFAEVAA